MPSPKGGQVWKKSDGSLIEIYKVVNLVVYSRPYGSLRGPSALQLVSCFENPTYIETTIENGKPDGVDVLIPSFAYCHEMSSVSSSSRNS